MKFLRFILFTVMVLTICSPNFAQAKKRKAKGELLFSEEHYKSFSLIAKTWTSKGCEKEVPKKTKDAIEKACTSARNDGGLYRPKLKYVSGSNYVQCMLSSDAGFLEIAMGGKKGSKLISNQAFAEFKLDPKGAVYAIAQEGQAVGAGYCEELEEEVTTRKSVMGYNTFQALFINQYSPGKRLTADQFFGHVISTTRISLLIAAPNTLRSKKPSLAKSRQNTIARSVASSNITTSTSKPGPEAFAFQAIS
jgi:hypothetical protein